MSSIKHVMSKLWYPALFLAVCFFALFFFELWEDRSHKIENYYVDQLIARQPQHRNVAAIKKARDSIAGRDPFRIAVLGDNRYNLKQLKKILQAIAQDKPDFKPDLWKFALNPWQAVKITDQNTMVTDLSLNLSSYLNTALSILIYKRAGITNDKLLSLTRDHNDI